MNKDYKLMAMLIPIILILGVALYIFPDASGLKTDIATTLLDQANNSSLNQSSNYSSIENQTNPINTQYSQDATNNNNNYSPTEPNDRVQHLIILQTLIQIMEQNQMHL